MEGEYLDLGPVDRVTCDCSIDGSCTRVEPDSKKQTGGVRFNGHWIKNPDGTLQFIIDRRWIEEPTKE